MHYLPGQQPQNLVGVNSALPSRTQRHQRTPLQKKKRNFRFSVPQRLGLFINLSSCCATMESAESRRATTEWDTGSKELIYLHRR